MGMMSLQVCQPGWALTNGPHLSEDPPSLGPNSVQLPGSDAAAVQPER